MSGRAGGAQALFQCGRPQRDAADEIVFGRKGKVWQVLFQIPPLVDVLSLWIGVMPGDGPAGGQDRAGKFGVLADAFA